MEQNNIVLFQSQDGQTRLEVKQAGESVWLRQEQIAELFGKDVSGVSRHIAKIFNRYRGQVSVPSHEELTIETACNQL